MAALKKGSVDLGCVRAGGRSGAPGATRNSGVPAADGPGPALPRHWPPGPGLERAARGAAGRPAVMYRVSERPDRRRMPGRGRGGGGGAAGAGRLHPAGHRSGRPHTAAAATATTGIGLRAAVGRQ